MSEENHKYFFGQMPEMPWKKKKPETVSEDHAHDHLWEGVWLSPDLEGYRCTICGKEQAEIEEDEQQVIVIRPFFMKDEEDKEPWTGY